MIECKFERDIKKLVSIAQKMDMAGLPPNLVNAAIRYALEFEGMFDLLWLWEYAAESQERDDTWADIVSTVGDIRVATGQK